MEQRTGIEALMLKCSLGIPFEMNARPPSGALGGLLRGFPAQLECPVGVAYLLLVVDQRGREWLAVAIGALRRRGHRLAIL